ncbi:MAG: tetratricopeptide repeat protein [Verrucomicrobiota bacterium]|nr:tetratricopeptide repeat protein [Verrucomicrobiota bacterium]
MKTRKIAAILVLMLGSIAANDVAPSKAELETMYDRAFKAFDGAKYDEALKELDAIDARKPDLAESQNLRGVILMREGIYDKAEAALSEALRLDPKFWNARFNLAEIPFLKKDWAEARKRFQQLLTGNAEELQGEATQLIQYKILLTYLLEKNDSMVDSILAKFELSPNTPAVHYANAAIALQHQNIPDAKNWMSVAEKNFSPQLNKLFAESLYEVGWLQKQDGQERPALQLLTQEERATKAKAQVQTKFEQAQQAYEQRDFAMAGKLAGDADTAEPNQPSILNLRGEISLEQQNYDEAESFFQKALKVDGKFREAQFNMADVPFRRKEYAKARDRFEALLKQTPGGDKNQASQLIKFKIFMTNLLEGKDSRAQKMMEQFQFSGDTPALYYAQAAWEFKHGNTDKANDWIASARKIYPLASNSAYGAGFYDLGWLKNAATTASSAPASDAAAQAMSRGEGGPAIEPSPIPGVETKAEDTTFASLAQTAASPVPGMEATSVLPNSLPASEAIVTATPPASVTASNLSAAGSPARPEDIPAVPSAGSSPAVELATASATPIAAPPITEEQPAPVVAQASATPGTPAVAVAEVTATPATVLAPATVRETTAPTAGERLDHFTEPRTLLYSGLLLAGLGVLAYAAVPSLRRRLSAAQIGTRPAPAAGPGLHAVDEDGPTFRAESRFTAGPRQVSVQLKASEPSIRRSAIPLTGRGDRFNPAPELEPEVNGVEEHVADAGVGPVLEQEVADIPAEAQPAYSNGHVEHDPITTTGEPQETFVASEPITEESTFAEPAMADEFAPAYNAMEAPVADTWKTIEEPVSAVSAPDVIPELEPVGQGQPVPYQTSVFAEQAEEAPVAAVERLPVMATAAIGALRESASSNGHEDFKSEPTENQHMPETLQTPTAPVLRTPTAGPQTQLAHTATAPQAAAGGMHTAVQITLSCEIASMQLTSSFKMGALQLRPVSKVVTMRLSPSQQPQPAMPLQVNFEIGKIQPAPGSFGQMRLNPSQLQKPASHNSPSFSISGLQLVSGHDAAPVQLTPQQQGQASVYLTAAFQIATVEFSPSFDIAAIILNATGKNVSVQLPGSGGNSIENAPVFEITNVQLGNNGDIAMLQLNPVGAKRV